MIKSILKGIAITAVLTMTASICEASKTDNDEIKRAVNILKGIDKTGSSDEAVRTLRDAAEKDTSVYAMNALGIAYMNALGVAQDSTKAVAWLEKAAEHGSPTALHNLGMMYKYARGGVRQNFAKAYGYFRRATDTGMTMALYDEGFMLYKGLGCTQNYEQAAALFAKGADKDHAPCMYMLGLCYRNGYGVERDEERAMFYLERASRLNYKRATEELARETPENSMNDICVVVDEAMEIPETMPAIAPQTIDTTAIDGTYQGMIIVYDWSGRNVIDIKPLRVDMNTDTQGLEGKWCEGKDTVTFKAMVAEDGQMTFKSGMIRKKERYDVKDSVAYRFENADINVSDNTITGSIRLYSMAEKEPERPMYICLNRLTQNGDGSDANITEQNGRIYAWPNPFSTQVSLRFELTEDVAEARVAIYNQAGMSVFAANLGALTQGKHSYTVSPAIPDGIYVLNLSAGAHTYKTIIVKKKGL